MAARGVPISQEKIRTRKRKRRFWVAVSIFSIIVIVWSGLSLVASASFLQVKNIEVTGVGDTEAAALRAAAENSLSGTIWYFFPHTNIFFAPTDAIETSLASAFPDIEKITVTRHLFDTLSIDVVPKNPEALWCLDAACEYLDQNGIAFEAARPVDVASSSLIVFGNGLVPEASLSPLSTPGFAGLMTFIHALPSRSVYPDAVAVADDGEVRVYVATSTYLLVDPTKDMTVSLGNLDSIFREKTADITPQTLSSLQYIDLRFPDKVFYK